MKTLDSPYLYYLLTGGVGIFFFFYEIARKVTAFGKTFYMQFRSAFYGFYRIVLTNPTTEIFYGRILYYTHARALNV